MCFFFYFLVIYSSTFNTDIFAVLMVGKRGWFESLQTTSRVPSSTSVEQNDNPKEELESGKLPAYNSSLVYIINSLQHALPSGLKCLQVHTLFKETITLAVHVSSSFFFSWFLCVFIVAFCIAFFVVYKAFGFG